MLSVMRWMGLRRKMSAHPFFFRLRFGCKLRQSAELDRAASEFPLDGTLLCVLSCFSDIFKRLRAAEVGKARGKWRENVDRVLYSDDCRARWKVVIGGKRNICSFLSYTWIAASHMSAGCSASVWQQGGKCGIEFQQGDIQSPGSQERCWTHFMLFVHIWITGLSVCSSYQRCGWKVKLNCGMIQMIGGMTLHCGAGFLFFRLKKKIMLR